MIFEDEPGPGHPLPILPGHTSPGSLERVLRAFEVSVARLVPQLEQGRASGDLHAIAHVAHTLKSSSASIGALELSRLCADCERRVREARVFSEIHPPTRSWPNPG